MCSWIINNVYYIQWTTFMSYADMCLRALGCSRKCHAFRSIIVACGEDIRKLAPDTWQHPRTSDLQLVVTVQRPEPNFTPTSLNTHDCTSYAIDKRPTRQKGAVRSALRMLVEDLLVFSNCYKCHLITLLVFWLLTRNRDDEPRLIQHSIVVSPHDRSNLHFSSW